MTYALNGARSNILADVQTARYQCNETSYRVRHHAKRHRWKHVVHGSKMGIFGSISKVQIRESYIDFRGTDLWFVWPKGLRLLPWNS